jgi:hypothetical protein
MSVFKRFLIAFLALGVMVTGSLTACNLTTTGQSPLGTQQVLANVKTAYEKINTVAFSVNGTMTAVMSKNNNDNILPVDIKFSGNLGVADKTMQMMGQISTGGPITGQQTIPIDIYVTDGWVYSRVMMPVIGEQWTKVKLDDQVWKRQDQFKQQLQFLETAVDINQGPDESVNGTACYVFTINPNMTTLIDWVMAQQQNSGLNVVNVNLASAFKDFSVKEWIAKDSNLPVKTEITVSLEIKPGDVGAAAKDFDRITLDLTMEQRFSDYNKAFSVKLPEGAAQAREIQSGTSNQGSTK